MDRLFAPIQLQNQEEVVPSGTGRLYFISLFPSCQVPLGTWQEEKNNRRSEDPSLLILGWMSWSMRTCSSLLVAGHEGVLLNRQQHSTPYREER